MNKSYGNGDRKMSQLPGWLWPNSNILPHLYKQIWDMVRDDRTRYGSLQREVLVDTNKIFPLLLTSQLPMEILGYIWSLANQKYAGQLTEQELYIVLALVALAQASYPFNSLEVLHFIRVPPIPTLNIALLSSQFTQAKPQMTPLELPNVTAGNQEKKYVPNTGMKQNNTSSNDKSTLPEYSHLNEFKTIKNTTRFNSFLDTKPNINVQQEVKTQASGSSADSGDEFSEFQSASIPSVPAIAILDTKQGSAIGSRLANHNLGVKKMNEKAKKNNVYKNQHFNTQSKISGTMNTVTQSRDLQCADRLSELFPKCPVKNQAKTVILKDTAIRSNEPPKFIQKNVNIDNHIDSNEFGNFVKADPLPDKIIAPKMPENTPQDLMSLQSTEDKYSALRALVEETTDPSPPLTVSQNDRSNLNFNTLDDFSENDDFGEFVSAEQPQHTTQVVDSLNIDLLTDFGLSQYSNNDCNNSKSDPTLMEEISDAFNALGMHVNSDHRMLDEKFEIIFETDKVTPKEDTVSVNSIDMGNGIPESLPRSASVPSLDLKSFLPSSQEDEQQSENMHQTIYSEWKQYMESCVLLLQMAANIFTSITSDVVLREVLSSAQGYNFLCNLAEVAAVCRRVNFSHKEMDINIMGFDDLLMDIDRIWAEMEPFYTNIPIVTELPIWPLHQGDSITCALCLTVITSGKVVYNENNYHVTCANLWLNCVNNHLPVLKYPLVQQTIVPPSTTSI